MFYFCDIYSLELKFITFSSHTQYKLNVILKVLIRWLLGMNPIFNVINFLEAKLVLYTGTDTKIQSGLAESFVTDLSGWTTAIPENNQS